METIKVTQLEYAALQKYTDHAKGFTTWGLIGRLRKIGVSDNGHFTAAETQTLADFINDRGLTIFGIAYHLAAGAEIEGYALEVEQPFQVGDWVIYTDHSLRNHACKVIDVQYCHDRIQFDKPSGWKHIDDVSRHATDEEIAQEKERRKWAAIGREVGEYRVGDIVRFTNSGEPHEITSKYNSGGWKLDKIHNPIFAEHITLIAPVEQRLDKEEA